MPSPQLMRVLEPSGATSKIVGEESTDATVRIRMLAAISCFCEAIQQAKLSSYLKETLTSGLVVCHHRSARSEMLGCGGRLEMVPNVVLQLNTGGAKYLVEFRSSRAKLALQERDLARQVRNSK